MQEDPPFNGMDSAHAEDLLLIKADILERLLAKFIDFLIMGAFFAFPSFIGPLAGATYILISDGLKGGQSLGKRIIGLKVVSDSHGNRPCDFKGSIVRNSVFGALIAWHFIVGWIPYLGPLLTFVVWAAVITIEIILIYTDEDGRRFGDRIAGTRVVAATVSGRAIS